MLSNVCRSVIVEFIVIISGYILGFLDNTIYCDYDCFYSHSVAKRLSKRNVFNPYNHLLTTANVKHKILKKHMQIFSYVLRQ